MFERLLSVKEVFISGNIYNYTDIFTIVYITGAQTFSP